MRIFKTLREEHGYPGCYNVIQGYVHDARIAANPDAAPRRKSYYKPHRKSPQLQSPGVSQGHNSITVSTPETVHDAPATRTLTKSYQLSQRPQRHREPDEHAFEWMRAVLQGAMPLDILEGDLGDIAPEELKILVAAATKGELAWRNKAMAVLAYSRGIGSTPISSFLEISAKSMFRFWKLFRTGGTQKLFERRPRSDKKSNNEAIKRAVFELLHSPPSAHGLNRTTWRQMDLRDVLRDEYNVSINCETIHTIIKEAGWQWRHARTVLTSNDPDYRAKVDVVKKTLAELRPDEAFFSIDEYGPFAIKQKGGVKQVAPGEQYVVAQWQKSKGWLILTAALELSRNQVIHFYSRKKNTDEMIKMADLLRSKYQGFSTIYLSWDAASWHVSKDLTAHLEEINRKSSTDGGPVVKPIPLPAGAQFLNVIESVFSGMARAIIHNSNYPSVVAATEAIDRYFEDRNEHYTQYPQRAGKKIWGKERVQSMFAEEQNCKDPMYQYPYWHPRKAKVM
jgi:transposase